MSFPCSLSFLALFSRISLNLSVSLFLLLSLSPSLSSLPPLYSSHTHWTRLPHPSNPNLIAQPMKGGASPKHPIPKTAKHTYAASKPTSYYQCLVQTPTNTISERGLSLECPPVRQPAGVPYQRACATLPHCSCVVVLRAALAGIMLYRLVPKHGRHRRKLLAAKRLGSVLVGGMRFASKTLVALASGSRCHLPRLLPRPRPLHKTPQP